MSNYFVLCEIPLASLHSNDIGIEVILPSALFEIYCFVFQFLLPLASEQYWINWTKAKMFYYFVDWPRSFIEFYLKILFLSCLFNRMPFCFSSGFFASFHFIILVIDFYSTLIGHGAWFQFAFASVCIFLGKFYESLTICILFVILYIEKSDSSLIIIDSCEQQIFTG